MSIQVFIQVFIQAFIQVFIQVFIEVFITVARCIVVARWLPSVRRTLEFIGAHADLAPKMKVGGRKAFESFMG